jgi:hypothetical protein
MSSAALYDTEYSTIEQTFRIGSAFVPVEKIHTLKMDQLLEVQSILGHGDTFGVWKTPRKWHPLGAESLLEINLKNRIIWFLPEPSIKYLNSLKGGSTDSEEISQEAFVDDIKLGIINKIFDNAILTFTRYLVICRIGPIGMKKASGRPIDPSHIASIAYNYFCILLALSVHKNIEKLQILADSSEYNFSDTDPLTLDLNWMKGSGLFKISESALEKCRIEADRFRLLISRGLWYKSTPTEVPRVYTEVKGAPLPIPAEAKKDPHLPLPDEYVSEMGAKSLWILENFGPSILRCLEGMLAVQERHANSNLSFEYISAKYKEFLKSFDWTDASGKKISSLPFLIKIPTSGRNKNNDDDISDEKADYVEESDDDIIQSIDNEFQSLSTWPPKQFSQIIKLTSLLQSAHLFILGLSMGARASELLSLERDCIQYDADGEGNHYANGRTYKLVRKNDGEIRQWYLPEPSVRAIEQQIKLIEMIECLAPVTKMGKDFSRTKGSHLWGTIFSTSRSRSEPLLRINGALVSYARSLGMETHPRGQIIRSHRFRKTIARLVALAITDSPKVLQDVFGHKTIEMTLSYILSDKSLQGETEVVTRELRVLRAVTTLEDILDYEDGIVSNHNTDQAGKLVPQLGGYGGMAAITISDAIKNDRQKAYKAGRDWGAENVRDLAETLTMQGKAWELVRPGVICTKLFGQSGPCNKAKGRPEASKCQTLCSHRLEEAWLQEDVEGAIVEAKSAYLDAILNEDELMRDFWAGQILLQLDRFPNMRLKFVNDTSISEIFIS